MDERFEYAIFDMDGTLLDSMPYWRYVSLEYLILHKQPVPNELLVRMYHTPAMKLLTEYSEQHALGWPRERIFAEIEELMNRHYLLDVRPKGSSPAYLSYLKEKGIRMCVATTTSRLYAANALRRQGMDTYFSLIMDDATAPCSKKHAEYFRWLAQQLGTTPDRCVVFEDAYYSMCAAKEAGMRVVAIEDGSQEPDRAQIRALADEYIQDYTQIM